jgi:hypothetical protein
MKGTKRCPEEGNSDNSWTRFVNKKILRRTAYGSGSWRKGLKTQPLQTKLDELKRPIIAR